MAGEVHFYEFTEKEEKIIVAYTVSFYRRVAHVEIIKAMRDDEDETEVPLKPMDIYRKAKWLERHHGKAFTS